MKTENFNNKHIQTELDILLELEEVFITDKQLILYDDPYNTFEFVIQSLIKVCKHDSIQAEQCTFLVHHTGKCSVKKGSYEALKPLCTALLEKGLTAEII
jgi:ATP-dependent Clp protease adaptor protein ClpS